MFLAEPPQTAWDLHFSLLRVPVRISPFFWLMSALLGFEFARGLADQTQGEYSVGLFLAIWILAVFISILVHEMGHALTFRYFGTEADIVLYHFGGLAVPRQTYRYGLGPTDSWRQIMISIAGPGAQLLLAVVLAMGIYAAGYHVPNPLPFWSALDFLEQGDPLPSIGLVALQYALILSSVWWALLNLVPVYPLDGGQIARELLMLNNAREGVRYSLMLSIAAAAGIALWAFSRQDTFLGLMFISLGVSSYLMLQQYTGPGGW